MTNSEILSTNQSPTQIIPKWLVAVFLIAALLGFLDTTYLTVKHYSGSALNCSAVFGNCEKVTTGKYATVGGIPLALIGAIYYLTIFILTIAYLDARRQTIMLLASFLTIPAFLASVGFVYLQLFIIKAICPYCMASATLTTILFIAGILIIRDS